jgi:hypothetical protein
MSIELLLPEKKYSLIYHVRKNMCNCHPETCCCMPFAVFDRNNELISTHFTKDIANHYAKLLNDKNNCTNN